jgi:hypothetical protein
MRRGKSDVTQDPTPTAEDVDAAFRAVCELMSTGMTQRLACRQVGTSPQELWRWAQLSDERREAYARARDSQARALAEEVLEIGDEATPETVQVAKLRTDSRKWMASKLLPREFGDHVQVTGTFANLDLNRLTQNQLQRLADGESPLTVLAPGDYQPVAPAGLLPTPMATE